MFEYGSSEDFERYYAELLGRANKRGDRSLYDERAEVIVFPRIMSVIASAGVLVITLVVLVQFLA